MFEGTCSWDCAKANGCKAHFVACEKCGRDMCGLDLNEDGICPDCAEREENKDD